MAIRAIMKTGEALALVEDYGESVDAFIDRLTDTSLTGSALPLADVKLLTADGQEIAYTDVNTFVAAADYEP